MSHCQCANGCWFCAHMGATLLLLYVIQKQNDMNYEAMKSFLPTPVLTIARSPIPLTYAFPPPGTTLSQLELLN